MPSHKERLPSEDHTVSPERNSSVCLLGPNYTKHFLRIQVLFYFFIFLTQPICRSHTPMSFFKSVGGQFTLKPWCEGSQDSCLLPFSQVVFPSQNVYGGSYSSSFRATCTHCSGLAVCDFCLPTLSGWVP